MEPVSIFVALVFMLGVLMIPGFILTYVILGDIDLSHRIIFGMFLGVMPVYVIYVLVKDNIEIFDLSTDLMVFGLFLVFILFAKNGREGIIKWLFASRNS